MSAEIIDGNFGTNADNPIGRYGIAGYYAVADGPQPPSVASRAFGVRWPEFDEIFKFYQGQFVVVSGIAGHGKSTFLFNLLLRLALIHRMSSFMYVPENENNLLDILSRIWWGGTYTDQDDAEAMFDYMTRELLFRQSSIPQAYDDEPKTLHWVLDRAYQAVKRDGVQVVLIDPWNELERAKPRDMLMTDHIGECLMYLKHFTRTMNVVTILVAHPTKAISESAGRMTSLADIEGSMNWFNKCDNGLIITRQPPPSKMVEVFSAKVREIGAGRIGKCYFTVKENSGLFTPVYGGVDL